MTARCEWCGSEVPQGCYKCEACKDKQRRYHRYTTRIHVAAPLYYLQLVDDLLFELKYGMPWACNLPEDLDEWYAETQRLIQLKLPRK